MPQAFRGHFAAYSEILTPALFMFGLILYGFNPAFQIARRTYPVVFAAAGAMIVNIVAAALLAPRIGPIAFAWAQLAGYTMALLIIAALAVRFAPIRINIRDVSLIVLATGIMVAALWAAAPSDAGPGLLAAMTALGVTVYAAIIIASDAAAFAHWHAP